MICVSIVSLEEALRLIADLCQSLRLIQSWYMEGGVGKGVAVALWAFMDYGSRRWGWRKVARWVPRNVDDFQGKFAPAEPISQSEKEARLGRSPRAGLVLFTKSNISKV